VLLGGVLNNSRRKVDLGRRRRSLEDTAISLLQKDFGKETPSAHTEQGSLLD
jgi:hypothetical protein